MSSYQILFCPENGRSIFLQNTGTFLVYYMMSYSYNKNQQDALFLKFISVKNSPMFRVDLLSIIRSLDTVFTAIGICHTEILKMGEIYYKNT